MICQCGAPAIYTVEELVDGFGRNLCDECMNRELSAMTAAAKRQPPKLGRWMTCAACGKAHEQVFLLEDNTRLCATCLVLRDLHTVEYSDTTGRPTLGFGFLAAALDYSEPATMAGLGIKGEVLPPGKPANDEELYYQVIQERMDAAWAPAMEFAEKLDEAVRKTIEGEVLRPNKEWNNSEKMIRLSDIVNVNFTLCPVQKTIEAGPRRLTDGAHNDSDSSGGRADVRLRNSDSSITDRTDPEEEQ